MITLTLAGASLAVAVLSLLRVKGVEQLQAERNDVTWTAELRGSKWVLKNAGADPALDVDYYLTIDGEAKHWKVPELAGSAETEAFDLRDHIGARRIAQRQATNGQKSKRPALMVSERILWKTPAGAQHRADPPPKEIEL